MRISNEWIGTLLSFWDDGDDSDFRVGFYLGGNEEYSLFDLVTTRGYEDGLYVTATDCIYRVQKEDAYTQRIGRLFRLQEQKCMLAEQDVKDCSPQWIFAYAQEQKLPVAVQLYDGETVAGMVRQWDDGVVFLDCLDENGRWNGVSQIRLDSISKIRCNSGEERLLLSLKEES